MPRHQFPSIRPPTTHFTPRLTVLLAAGLALLAAACSGDNGGPAGGAPTFVARLTPEVPDSARSLQWSPYGQKLSLTPAADGDSRGATDGAAGGAMTGELTLGPGGTPPMRLELSRTPGAEHYDRLGIDFDRDGRIAEEEILATTPTESRHKFWSSFDTVVTVPAVDPATGDNIMNPYALSFWYVEDPAEPDAEPVLRFSRRGWMEGRTTVNGVAAEVLITENAMDGVFDTLDSWALAPADSADQVLGYQVAHPIAEHAWLGEQAYRVASVDPSGRRVVITPFDPGMTRAEEAAINDHLRVDREAARNGPPVAFLHDFDRALEEAQQEDRPLFIDFETTWCGPCKLMDQWVYTADSVAVASRGVVAVKVDGDDHPDLAKRFQVAGYPTLILLDPDGTELRRLSGYVSVADMTDFLTTR